MAKARLFHATLPMRGGFAHPAARRTQSDSLVLHLSLDGVSGIGECAPRSYVTGETTRSVQEALEGLRMEALFDTLRTADSRELLTLLQADGFEKSFGIVGENNLVCLLETAVFDLLGQRLWTGVQEMLATSIHDTAEAVAPVPVTQVIDLEISAEDFLATRGPFHFVKVKASGDIVRDEATVRTIRDRLGPDVPVAVDANMSWTFDDALHNMKILRDHGVDLFEEPLQQGSWAGMRELRRRTGASIMLDESLCTLDQARTAVETEACDAFNIRVAKCGGLINSTKLIDYARQNGIQFQIGVQVAEVGPLINASRALAFVHRDAFTVEGGQSDRFFSSMIVAPAPAVDRTTNTISPVAGPGFGLSLNGSADSYAVLEFTDNHDQWRPTTTTPEVKAQ